MFSRVPAAVAQKPDQVESAGASCSTWMNSFTGDGLQPPAGRSVPGRTLHALWAGFVQAGGPCACYSEVCSRWVWGSPSYETRASGWGSASGLVVLHQFSTRKRVTRRGCYPFDMWLGKCRAASRRFDKCWAGGKALGFPRVSSRRRRGERCAGSIGACFGPAWFRVLASASPWSTRRTTSCRCLLPRAIREVCKAEELTTRQRGWKPQV